MVAFGNKEAFTDDNGLEFFNNNHSRSKDDAWKQEGFIMWLGRRISDDGRGSEAGINVTG